MPDKQKAPPPDQQRRERALDAARSILVRAPAGSGKTDLLARRFLRLLGEVNEPGTYCWAELTTPELDAAKRFYGSVFGLTPRRATTRRWPTSSSSATARALAA